MNQVTVMYRGTADFGPMFTAGVCYKGSVNSSGGYKLKDDQGVERQVGAVNFRLITKS